MTAVMSVAARGIRDSRGKPTIEVAVQPVSGASGRASQREGCGVRRAIAAEARYEGWTFRERFAAPR